MLLSAVALAAAVTAGPCCDCGSYLPTGGRILATRATYPANQADDVDRPGFNGRVWVSRPRIGGERSVYEPEYCGPGPAAYGASAYDTSRVYVCVNDVVVGISPWEAQHNKRLERGRQQWLRERGYTGGVRTFINDLAMPEDRPAVVVERDAVMRRRSEAPGAIKPRAVFRINPDIPRTPSRLEVSAPVLSPVAKAAFASTAPIKVLPREMPRSETKVALAE